VKVDEALTPGKIRDTNSYTLYGLVKLQGGQPIRLPIAGDTLQDVRHLFLTALEQHPDLIISSAGVSVGAADLVRTVLEELGKIDLWRINMRPGKPLAFGQIQNVPFFGLPGNPVSAMVTFEIFVRPAILKLAGREGEMGLVQAIVGEDIRSDGRRSYLRVRLTRNQGQWVAYTTGTQSSGALMSMVLADGLLIVPEGVTFVQEGTELPVRLLRHLQTVTGEMK
jgi:molybdopterin molybdotransferase